MVRYIIAYILYSLRLQSRRCRGFDFRPFCHFRVTTSQEFTTCDNHGVWRTKVPSGVRDRAPLRLWAKPQKTALRQICMMWTPREHKKHTIQTNRCTILVYHALPVCWSTEKFTYDVGNMHPFFPCGFAPRGQVVDSRVLLSPSSINRTTGLARPAICYADGRNNGTVYTNVGLQVNLQTGISFGPYLSSL